MKKINLLITGLLLCVFGASAQTYYYDATRMFIENGYIYQCDITQSGGVVLYNKYNRFTYTQQAYKNGTVLAWEHWDEVEDVQEDTWTKLLAQSIVKNAFTASEKYRCKGEYLGITMIISPETGQVIEVSFDFMSMSGYATVPVSTYRQIETELKSQIWFTPTAEGKKMNYLMRGWMQKIK